MPNFFETGKISQNFLSAVVVIGALMIKSHETKRSPTVCLFVLLLYVPSQQLWSLQDGQFT